MTDRLNSIYILLLAVGISIGNDCNKPCYCNITTQMAVCNSRHLRYIPRLPSYVKYVKLIQNNFTFVDKAFFRNLTSYNEIVVLNMTNNWIHNISRDAFEDFHMLNTLEISTEHDLDIGILKSSLKSLGGSVLQNVLFTGHEWDTLPQDIFSALQNHNISFVSLTSDGLQEIDGNAFLPLKNLKSLDLSSNKLVKVTLNGLYNLDNLRLTDNDLQQVPSTCDFNGTSLVPSLNSFYLNGNSITKMDNRSFRCLGNLTILYLSYNNFRYLENNTFGPLKRLKMLNLSNLARLIYIQETALNSSSLELLYFQNNRFHFDKVATYKPKTLFQYCPNLKKLDLSNNFLPSNISILKTIFWPQVRLEKLTLPNTRLRIFPFCIMKRLTSLKTLNLQGNYISGWNDSEGIFRNISSLETLNLQANNIRLVNQTTFPTSLLSTLKSLDLSDNQFSCTCELKWFRDWIRENIESLRPKFKLKLKGYPRKYSCMFPSRLRGELLKNYNPTEKMCREKSLIMTVVAISVSVVVVATIVVFVLYSCQTNIRNYIYLMKFNRKRRSGYTQIDTTDYMYEAFVVYANNDRDWVHNILLKKFESEENMRICIHHRDFDVGVPVTANIGKYMSLCRKIVVVMTNSFAESEWCQWEVDLVQERRRQQGKDVSILIMLENIDSNHMTDSLKTLLDSTNRVQYCKGIGEKLFWKALVKWVRKPFGQPPVAVL